MARLYLAAGGGGDALAAAIIHRASGEHEPAAIATYAWDRLAVDPLPGPRASSDFDGLRPVGSLNYAFTPTTKPRPPAGSTLPRLSGDLAHELLLLDPYGGAVHMRAQLAELVELYDADAVRVVDVGGDILARGDEPALRSPLADALALAACVGLAVPVTVHVAGPGLDGELPEPDVLARVAESPGLPLAAADVDPFRHIFDWHPSEATALLVAAARGLRGNVEIRDAGLPVHLTDASSKVFVLPLRMATTDLVHSLKATTSLDAVEHLTRARCGFTELDYEREKARARASRNGAPEDPVTAAEIAAFQREARERGIDWVTFRRLTEALQRQPTPETAATFRQWLIAESPERFEWPLWSIAAPRSTA